MLQPEPLIFPRGVRLARPEEIPSGRQDELANLANARITTGFVETDHRGESFRAYFEANVHAPRLWEAFEALAVALLPETAAPIVGRKDEEPVFGPYTTRDAALGVLRPHSEALQHDGFLQFGIIFQRHGRTEEVFVPSVKYLRIWTNRPDEVRRVFEQIGVPEVPDLQFIDEYPRVSQMLREDGGNAVWPPVFEQIRSAFDTLSPVPPPDESSTTSREGPQ